MATQNQVVDFIWIDKSFPSGRASLGVSRFEKELRERYPKGYIQSCSGELDMREKLTRQLNDATVKKVLWLWCREVEVGTYWMRYYHLQFVPVEGYWIL